MASSSPHAAAADDALRTRQLANQLAAVTAERDALQQDLEQLCLARGGHMFSSSYVLAERLRFLESELKQAKRQLAAAAGDRDSAREDALQLRAMKRASDQAWQQEQQRADALQQELAFFQASSAKAIADRDTATFEARQAQQQCETQASSLREAQAQLTALSTQFEAANASLAARQQHLEAARAELARSQLQLRQLPPLQQQLRQLQATLAETQAELAAATAHSSLQQDQIATLQQQQQQAAAAMEQQQGLIGRLQEQLATAQSQAAEWRHGGGSSSSDSSDRSDSDAERDGEAGRRPVAARQGEALGGRLPTPPTPGRSLLAAAEVGAAVGPAGAGAAAATLPPPAWASLKLQHSTAAAGADSVLTAEPLAAGGDSSPQQQQQQWRGLQQLLLFAAAFSSRLQQVLPEAVAAAASSAGAHGGGGDKRRGWGVGKAAPAAAAGPDPLKLLASVAKDVEDNWHLLMRPNPDKAQQQYQQLLAATGSSATPPGGASTSDHLEAILAELPEHSSAHATPSSSTGPSSSGDEKMSGSGGAPPNPAGSGHEAPADEAAAAELHAGIAWQVLILAGGCVSALQHVQKLAAITTLMDSMW